MSPTQRLTISSLVRGTLGKRMPTLTDTSSRRSERDSAIASGSGRGAGLCTPWPVNDVITDSTLAKGIARRTFPVSVPRAIRMVTTTMGVPWGAALASAGFDSWRVAMAVNAVTGTQPAARPASSRSVSSPNSPSSISVRGRCGWGASPVPPRVRSTTDIARGSSTLSRPRPNRGSTVKTAT